jgi:endoglucanase
MTVDERNKVAKLSDYFIDTGLTPEEVKEFVKIGDPITREREFIEMGNCVNSKSLDNRLAVFILIETLKNLKDKTVPYDIYGVFTVQEEVGLRGATTLINKLPDDLINVLIIDVSPITDIYDETSCRVGSGALIRIQDPGMIFNYEVVNQLRELAQVNNIAFQEFFSTGGTDSRVVEIAKSGHIVGAICIPARALHAQNTVASIDDINAACNLATAYIYDVIGG